MNYYRTSTLGDSIELINNIRQEDKQEVEGTGLTVLDLPFLVAGSSHATTFFNPKEHLAGMAGIVDHANGSGQIWMLCTPVIHDAPVLFIRQAKRWLKLIENDYQLLWNWADTRNHMHHKLLKHLGFKAIRTVPIGPDNLPYFEIIKLCASQQQLSQQPR